jgi:hypothetical protein
VLRTLSLCTCCRHYPGAAAGRNLRSCTQPYQPSPISLSGRPARRFFRGLLGVHSRCGLHTRTVTKSRPLSRGFRHFVTSMPAPVASGWSGCRVGLAPTGKRRLARRTGHATTGTDIFADYRQQFYRNAMRQEFVSAMRAAGAGQAEEFVKCFCCRTHIRFRPPCEADIHGRNIVFQQPCLQTLSLKRPGTVDHIG